MKKLKIVAIWAMLSILMQVAGLLYFDKILFRKTEKSSIKISDVETKEKVGKVNYSIPEGVDNKDVKISDDGSYLAYIQDKKLMVVNLDLLKIDDESKEENTTTPEQATREIVTNVDKNGDGINDAEIMFYKWIEDEDFLIIVERYRKSEYSSVVKLVTYNVRTNELHDDIKELCTYKEGMVVDNIACSLGTGTNYVGISRDGYNSNIYRVDINGDVSKITYNLPSLGNFAVVEDYDILAFEDSLNKRFYYYTNDNTESISIENANNLVLLGVDDDKNVYLGELSGEKVKKIIYGAYDSKTDTLQNIYLDKEKDLEDIAIESDGSILTNDNLSGVISNLNTKDTISYEGKFIHMTNNYICSEEDGKLILKSITDVDKKVSGKK